MIRFKDLSTSDRDLILSFTYGGDRQNCDLSFANLISWRYLYNTQFAIFGQFLLFRFRISGHLAYMAPIASPSRGAEAENIPVRDPESLKTVIKAIREDATALGQPFLMLGICEPMRQVIEQIFPGEFTFKADRDHADYIYLREKLVTLSGKKLQSKRNHSNRFRKLYPHFIYKPLTKDLIPQCLELEKQWRVVSKNDTPEISADEDLSGEFRSMVRAFHRWDKLGLSGGTIWVDDHLVAFTFGCPINKETFDICVEKADIRYEGAFAVINQEFAAHIPQTYTYINREEDLGREGLRQAKLSYKPHLLLEKYAVMEKHPHRIFEDTERITAQTKALWQQVFNDIPAFVDLYFDKVFKPAYNITAQISGRVVAALQALPYTFKIDEQQYPTAYLSGVAVLPELQGTGIGSNLLLQTHDALYRKHTVFTHLIPCDEDIVRWYKKNGYADCITCTPGPEGYATMDYPTFDHWQQSQKAIILHDATQWKTVLEDIALAGADHQPQTSDRTAMIRVINALEALRIYARLNPQSQAVIRVCDDHHIAANNAYYVLSQGQVKKTDEPYKDAIRLSIHKLSQYILQDLHPTMCLMLQ